MQKFFPNGVLIEFPNVLVPCNVYEQNMDQQFEINVKGLTIEVVKTSSCGLLTLWGTPSLLQFSLKNRSRSLSERVAAHTTSSGPDESKEGDGQGRSCRVWVYGTFSSSSSSFCIESKTTPIHIPLRDSPSASFTLCFECDATQTVQRASCPAEKKVAFGTEQKRRNKR